MREKGVAVKAEAKRRFYDWRRMTLREKKEAGVPLTNKGICRELNITYPTFQQWDKDYNGSKPILLAPKAPMEPSEFDTKEYLRKDIRIVADTLLKKVKGGKASSRDYELYYKLTGVITASENKGIIINGAFFAEKAKHDSKGDGARVVEVQERPALLHQPVREDTGQSGAGDTSVPSVGLPDTDSPDNPEQ